MCFSWTIIKTGWKDPFILRNSWVLTFKETGFIKKKPSAHSVCFKLHMCEGEEEEAIAAVTSANSSYSASWTNSGCFWLYSKLQSEITLSHCRFSYISWLNPTFQQVFWAVRGVFQNLNVIISQFRNSQALSKQKVIIKKMCLKLLYNL